MTDIWVQQATKELLVKERQVVNLEAGTHPPFTRIIIEAGGILRCNRAEAWLLLYSRGDCIIHGTIQCRQFRSGLGRVIATSPQPDAHTLDVVYLESARGGNGADSKSEPVGKGGKGTTAFGGGGASGAGRWNVSNNAESNDAKGRRGGRKRGHASGGSGGLRRKWSNGGCLYLRVDGALNGKGGIIDARGEEGSPGGEGGKGDRERAPARRRHGRRRPWMDTFPGQGGGGGPGGDAGSVAIKVHDNLIVARPRILLSGGIGGAPGLNGQWRDGHRTDKPVAKRGQKGSDRRPIWLTDW